MYAAPKQPRYRIDGSPVIRREHLRGARRLAGEHQNLLNVFLKRLAPAINSACAMQAFDVPRMLLEPSRACGNNCSDNFTRTSANRALSDVCSRCDHWRSGAAARFLQGGRQRRHVQRRNNKSRCRGGIENTAMATEFLPSVAWNLQATRVSGEDQVLSRKQQVASSVPISKH